MTLNPLSLHSQPENPNSVILAKPKSPHWSLPLPLRLLVPRRHPERSERPPQFALALALALAFATQAAAQSPLGKAKWIAAPFSTPRDGAELDGSHPMPLFRRAFTVRGQLKSATLKIAGLGQFQATLDAQPIGPAGIHQSWTDYRKTVTFETYTLTSQIHPGTNVLAVALGNGMYNVQSSVMPNGKGRYTKFEATYGPPKLIAALTLTYKDGQTETIPTDAQWKTAPGPTVFDSTYGGEDYDARKLSLGWERPIFDDAAWLPAILVASPGGTLIPAIAPEVVQTHAFAPIPKSTKLPDGRVVYDLAQNATGIVRIHVRGPAGAILKLTPSELLNPDGSVTQASSGGPMWWTYTLAGTPTGETWQSQFGFYGFRYVQAEWVGTPGQIVSIAGISLSSNTTISGTFETSNPTLNAIHKLIVAAMHNNELSIFTDCPHREKLGWLEQTHLAAPSLLFNNDLRALYAATDRNMADAQHDSGLVPTTAPKYTQFGPTKYNDFDDSPEWGSASILAPWWVYRFYGDRSQLATAYPVMQHYLAFLQSKAAAGIVAYGLGDWYDIGPGAPGYSKLTTRGVTATLMLYEDADALAHIATLLGHPEDAAQYSTLAETEKQAFNARFLSPSTGIYDKGSQTAQAMPLALGIVPEAAKAKVLAALVADIHAHSDHTTAGEIGFPYELRALAQNGQNDLIYAMVTNPTAPSYAAQLATGATALTEAWDANPKSSQDHFMLGHAEDWFYRSLAGIDLDLSRPDPTRRILIHPTPVAGLNSAAATYRSALGEIKVAWHRKATVLTLDIMVPVASTLQIPNQAPQPLTAGHHHLTFPTWP